jgi:hypothetical protein
MMQDNIKKLLSITQNYFLEDINYFQKSEEYISIKERSPENMYALDERLQKLEMDSSKKIDKNKISKSMI